MSSKPGDNGHEPLKRSRSCLAAIAAAVLRVAWLFNRGRSHRRAGPVIVLETVKGVIEFETYPEEAPKTVARIVELVKKGFYNGQRFHRAERNFVIQIGDPQSRNMTYQDWWGSRRRGKPIGVAGDHEEAAAHPWRRRDGAHGGSAACRQPVLHRFADRRRSSTASIHRLRPGDQRMDVAAKIVKADVLKKASVKE